jgi:hypothetical protein
MKSLALFQMYIYIYYMFLIIQHTLALIDDVKDFKDAQV